MGTIVINQTDCKQNIVLQSSVDGITGGYYDAEGEWHDLGGEETPFDYNVFRYGNLIKETSSSSVVYQFCWVLDNSTSYMHALYPIAYNNIKVRAIDETVEVMAIDITNPVPYAKNIGGYKCAYQSISDSVPAYGAESVVTGPYAWVSVHKKTGNFTDDDLVSPCGTLFEVV